MPARTGLAVGALVLAAASLSACAGSAPSLALAPAVLPAPPPGPPSPPVPAIKPASFTQIGTASWYGRAFHHRPTASGEPYDMHALTAAHRSLPLDTLVRVTNLDNGRSVVVRINDRGPYEPGRVIDLSAKAARVLRMKRAGLARVRIDLYRPQMATGGDAS